MELVEVLLVVVEVEEDPLTSDNAVDTHLNTASASAGEILSWNGTDYAWVTDQSGDLEVVG